MSKFTFNNQSNSLNEPDNKYQNTSNKFIQVLPPSVKLNLEPAPCLDDFEEKEQLGKGSFGRVFKAIYKITGEIFAIKEVDKKRSDKENCNREIDIMYKLDHINIVKLYSHFESNQFLYFVMEYCNGDNLFLLRKNQRNNKFNDKKSVYFIVSLINAIDHLHNQNPPIIHRDIKLENLLLTKTCYNNNEINILKLTDFGWSAFLLVNEERNTFCGTKSYMPPEILNNQIQNFNVDIWCIGVLLFELTTGKLPFPGDEITMRSNIQNGKVEYIPDMNPQLKDLISKILKVDPNKRLSLKEIKEHPYIIENLKLLNKNELEILNHQIKFEINDKPIHILNKNLRLNEYDNNNNNIKSLNNNDHKSNNKTTKTQDENQNEIKLNNEFSSNIIISNNNDEIKKLLNKILEENSSLKKELKIKIERFDYELSKIREELNNKYLEVIELKGKNEDLLNQIEELKISLILKENYIQKYEDEIREKNSYIKILEEKNNRKSNSSFNADDEIISNLKTEKDLLTKNNIILEDKNDNLITKNNILQERLNNFQDEEKYTDFIISSRFQYLLNKYEDNLKKKDLENFELTKFIKILEQEKELYLC